MAKMKLTLKLKFVLLLQDRAAQLHYKTAFLIPKVFYSF